MRPSRIALAILLLLAIALPIVVMTQGVSTPASWNRVHVDMAEANIHALAGAPAFRPDFNPSFRDWHVDMWQQKSQLVDRWMHVLYQDSARPGIATEVRVYSVWHLGREFATMHRKETTKVPAAATMRME